MATGLGTLPDPSAVIACLKPQIAAFCPSSGCPGTGLQIPWFAGILGELERFGPRLKSWSPRFESARGLVSPIRFAVVAAAFTASTTSTEFLDGPEALDGRGQPLLAGRRSCLSASLLVEGDALNFFLPFRRLEPNHENQLTRALLVVLRYSPMAHATWLRLVAPQRHLQQLPVAGFRTQTRAVRHAREEDDPADLLSVFLTPEAPLTGSEVVITESDRTQDLDAVIDYGGELLVVIENKVADDDDRQAREINLQGGRIRLTQGQEPVVVLWRDVLEAFIALRERSLVAGAEAMLLDDFLLYTEDHFPDLGPFRTLRLAHGNRFRQTRRLRQLLGEAVGLDAGDRRPRPLRRDACRGGDRREKLPAHDRRRRADRAGDVCGRHAQPGASLLYQPRRRRRRRQAA